MDFYVLEIENFIKIGVSEEIERRVAEYKNVSNKKIFSIDSTELSRYIEAMTQEHFKSKTEFIYNVSFMEVCNFVEYKLNTVFRSFNFNPLNIELKISSDGYYDIKPLVEHINDFRAKKGRKEIFPADYIKTKSSKEFYQVLNSKEEKIGFITKAGRYGGTYATPYAMLDFLIWSDVSIKYEILNWMYNQTVDYKSFVNAGVEPNKALNIATKNATQGAK